VLVRYVKTFRPGLASRGGATRSWNAHLTVVAQNFRKVAPDFDRRVRDTDCDRVDSDEQVAESGRWPAWGENRRNLTRNVYACSREQQGVEQHRQCDALVATYCLDCPGKCSSWIGRWISFGVERPVWRNCLSALGRSGNQASSRYRRSEVDNQRILLRGWQPESKRWISQSCRVTAKRSNCAESAASYESNKSLFGKALRPLSCNAKVMRVRELANTNPAPL
jgi:hypothetical protein